MSHFYCVVHSDRKRPVTACSRKTTGTQTVAAGWRGAVETTLAHDEKTGRDTYVVRLIPWQTSEGRAITLASGILDATLTPC